MAAEWFYEAKGSELGPVDGPQLRHLADSRLITPSTLVRKGRDGQWGPAERVQGLFPWSGSASTEAGAALLARSGYPLHSSDHDM